MAATTINIDATGSGSAGIDYSTFISEYVKDLTGAAYNFYGGDPDIFMGSTYYANGEQLSLNYKEDGVSTDHRIVLEGDIAYDFIHHGLMSVHAFSGEVTGITFGNWNSNTTATEGTGADGKIQGLSELLKISGLDLNGAVGSGSSNAIHSLYKMFNLTAVPADGIVAGSVDVAKIYALLGTYAQNFIGSVGNDTYAGTNNDDIVTGNAGNDALDGAGGNDTAVFTGTSADYTLTKNQDGSWTVEDLRTTGTTDGTDTLTNIENVQFSDKTLDISDGNQAPTSLALSKSTIDENAAVNTVVGVLSATDPEGKPLTYTLSDDAGGKFKIVTTGGQTQLVVAGALDYETATNHSIKVKVSDGVKEVEKSFNIAVGDVADTTDQSRGTITMDASGSNGIDFDSFLLSQFLAGTTGGFPTFDNDPNVYSGKEAYFNYGDSASSKYVTAHGLFGYDINTHRISGDG